MVDPIPFPVEQAITLLPAGKAGELASGIRREMYRCYRVSVRFSTKIYDLECQKETEAWMLNQGWVVKKSVDDEVVRYCIFKEN